MREYNAGQVLPHIGHVSEPHGKETFIASRCLAQATLDRWNRKEGVCCALWAWRIAGLQRLSRTRHGVLTGLYPISGYQPYALPWGVRWSTLGRTVVLQLTAQELLPYNLRPGFALQSLTGG